ncbi:ankyrin repeat domain-containing protein 61-like isoform X2 [Sardina pilchardus]|uniref:ankyrin repeat domain-containing protein 61-like isoform X2 n=1 Tax=Sardina pilchardus TaxID=27697 RepID=UPI002E12FBB2
MTNEGIKYGLGSADTFYEAIMTENVECLRNPENRPLVCLPLNNVKRIGFTNQGLAILPVHLAATYRKVQSLEVLLDAGANPELRDQRGRNALHLVITHWPNIVPAWPMPRSKLRVTMETMQQRAEDCLQVLCEHGVDLNARVSNDTQQTALHLAVRYGALPAVGILASCGANVNLADMVGMMPLHMAAGVLHTEITTCLIELGADVNRTLESSGNTPLHMAVRAEASSFADTQSNSLSCITALLEGGAKLDAMNLAGRTPLHEACSAGREVVVDVLLHYGADINKLSTRGETCLFLFLEHKPNLSNTRLLGKLLYLTLPLKLTNSQGILPKCLELPEHAKQRSQLIHFATQPRDLQSLCKIRIYQLYGEDDKPTLSELLPSKIIDFIFDYWENPLEIDFTKNMESPLPRFQFYPNFIPQHFPNVPPRFDARHNSNTQPNFPSNPPNFQHIPRNPPNYPLNVPNTPRDFTAQHVSNTPQGVLNIPPNFPNLQQEFHDILRNLTIQGVPLPTRGVIPPQQGVVPPPRDVVYPPRGVPLPPRGVSNLRQDAPNIPRGIPNIQHVVLPNTPSSVPNIPQGVPNIQGGVQNIQRAFQDTL